MFSLSDVITTNEEWLFRRIGLHIKYRGYSGDVPTLEQARRNAIRGLSAEFLSALADEQTILPPQAGMAQGSDPITNFGVIEARRHRSRGVTLGLFFGMMKIYRQSFHELIEEKLADGVKLQEYLMLIHNFFDRIELGFCCEWSACTENEIVRELQEQNRWQTNEKNKYLTIFESLVVPIVLMDDSGNVDNMNPAAAALFATEVKAGANYYGVQKGKAVCKPAALPQEIVDRLRALLRSPSGQPVERTLATIRGLRCYEISVQRMQDTSEKFAGTVIIFNDVTESRQAQEQMEQASRAKSAFLATMSHEVRTPINGILGLAELLGRSELAEQQRSYVEKIGYSGELLLSMINNILAYTRIEAGILDLMEVDFSVAKIVEDALVMTDPIAVAKGLRLTAGIEPGLPDILRGDPTKLRQILVNLLGNAIKFTEHGEVALRVRRQQGNCAAMTLHFEIEDTGPGIPSDVNEELFDPFVQLAGHAQPGHGGSGLGLAICRRLVTAMNGTIGFTSQIGKGSCFWFTATFRVGSTAYIEPEPAHRGGQLAPLSLLVIEDNEVNALVAQRLLEHDGHRVRLAKTGAAALAELEIGDFDVVLTDLRLTDMNGMEVARRIRKMPEAAKSGIPIIALSAEDRELEGGKARRAGINDFVTKPFRMKRLRQALRAVMKVPGAAGGGPASGAEPMARPSALLDESILAEHIAALGREAVAEIISAYRSNSAMLMERIRTASENGRWCCRRRGVLREDCHSMKSAAATLGLLRLSKCAEAIEAAAIADGRNDMRRLVIELSNLFEPSTAALDAYFSHLGAEAPDRLPVTAKPIRRRCIQSHAP